MTQAEFKNCFNEYFDAIRRYMYYRSGDAALSTDIAQEVFMKIWEKQFDTKNIKGLLYKIANDLYISHLRKNKVANTYIDTLNLSLNAMSGQDALQYEELKENYEKALAALPEKQRVVFLMSRMESLTYKEIAERLDLSVKAIEKRMSLAIATLKQKLQYESR